MARKQVFVLMPRKGSAVSESWSDYVRGEYWIDDTGSTYADQDIGDVGHEAIALSSMLDKEILADGLIEHWQGIIDELEDKDELTTEDEDRIEILRHKIAEVEDIRDRDELEAATLFFNYDIPDEVGIAASRDAEVWHDMVEDARGAYAKHYGAILAIDTNFAAWKVTKDTIEAIKDHLFELAGQYLDTPSRRDEVTVEEFSTKRSVTLPMTDFLNISSPRDLWALA